MMNQMWLFMPIVAGVMPTLSWPMTDDLKKPWKSIPVGGRLSGWFKMRFGWGTGWVLLPIQTVIKAGRVPAIRVQRCLVQLVD